MHLLAYSQLVYFHLYLPSFSLTPPPSPPPLMLFFPYIKIIIKWQYTQKSVSINTLKKDYATEI